MLLNIQALRALAACLVVVYHVQNSAAQTGGIGRFFPIGAFGVDIFFVISGFIMFQATQGFRKTAKKFMIDRAIRILPMYWGATLALLALFAVGFHPNGLHSVVWLDIASSFALFPRKLAASREPVLLILGWTLIYEMMFYILFAATFRFRSQQVSFSVLTMIFVCLTGLRFFSNTLGFTAQYFTSSIIFEFLFGCGLSLIYRRITLPGSTVFTIGMLLILLGIWLVWERDPNTLPQDLSLTSRSIVAGFPAMMIVAGALCLERQAITACWRAIQLLGAASYSLYLTHPFVLQPAIAITRRLSPFSGIGMTVAITIVSLAAAITVGVLVHLLIELPMTGWLRRRFALPIQSDKPIGSAQSGRPSEKIRIGGEA